MAGWSMIQVLLAAPLLLACSPQPGGNAAESAAVTTGAAATAALAVGNAATAEPAQAKNEAFATFWARFAAAALAGDARGIAQASAPKVARRGPLDDDVASITPQQVPAAIATVLADPQPIDASGRSLRAVLGGADVPARDKAQPLGYRRVGPLVFEQRAGRWLLTTIYVEE